VINTVVGEKLTRYDSWVRGCIVITERPIAREPQLRSFSPNVLPQTAKKIAVELGVEGLAFGGKHGARTHVLPSVGVLWN
jgi:hypothetical protein